MYYVEDYLAFIKDVEKLDKEIKEFQTDNEELIKIKSLLNRLSEHHVVLTNAVASNAGVDIY
jgi:hypothetical protein